MTLDLVVVDHIHKMRQPGTQSKVAEYTEISAAWPRWPSGSTVPCWPSRSSIAALKLAMTSARSLPICAESGSIEQDADTVLFVYRPAYYLERKRCADPNAEADRLADLEAVANRLELIIEKQRSGPIGTIDLWCDMASNVVRDPAESPTMEMAA